MFLITNIIVCLRFIFSAVCTVFNVLLIIWQECYYIHFSVNKHRYFTINFIASKYRITQNCRLTNRFCMALQIMHVEHICLAHYFYCVIFLCRGYRKSAALDNVIHRAFKSAIIHFGVRYFMFYSHTQLQGRCICISL